jgi:cytochrome c oxidase subunit 2
MQSGPSLYGVFGSMQTMADNSQVLADEAYVRQSILQPQAHVAKGSAPAMPSFAGTLSESDIPALIACVRSMVVRPH